MKIIHITASLSRNAGGPFVSVRRLVQCLAEHGCSMEIIGLADEHFKDDLQLWQPLVPKAFTARLPKSFGYVPAMRKELDSMNPNLIHLNGIWTYPSLLAFIWSQKHQIPHIISPRGMLEPWAMKHHAWKKRPLWWAWEKRNLECASVLHATAPSEAESLRELGLKNPIAIIPNGVDLPSLRERMPRTDGFRTVLFLSRIHSKKGLLNLVEAWRQLRPKGWRAIIAGPDEAGHLAQVKSAVSGAKLEEEFEFPGPVHGDQKWELYQRADIFVLPTFSENFGIVIAEALASGIPVVTTKAAPWEELVSQACGWWIDVGVNPLVAALREAMSITDEERREMGMRGRKLVEARFSWPEIAADMKAVYEWVLDGGTPPDCVRLE